MERQVPNVFAQFLDCLDSVAVIIASSVAIWGINAWKREHVGRRRIDLAEETLALFYETRDAINASRSSFGQAGDTQLRKEWSDEGNPRYGEPVGAPLLDMRLTRKQAGLFSRIRALKFRFAAVFGREKAQSFEGLMQIRRDVFLAEYEFLLTRDDPKGNDPAHKARQAELMRVMYRGDDESDPTTQRLDKIVEAIESVCRPEIENRSK